MLRARPMKQTNQKRARPSFIFKYLSLSLSLSLSRKNILTCKHFLKVLFKNKKTRAREARAKSHAPRAGAPPAKGRGSGQRPERFFFSTHVDQKLRASNKRQTTATISALRELWWRNLEHTLGSLCVLGRTKASLRLVASQPSVSPKPTEGYPMAFSWPKNSLGQAEGHHACQHFPATYPHNRPRPA